MSIVNYIEGLESEIVDRLKTITPHESIKAQFAPETDAERPTPSSIRANLFVMYSGSRYGEARSTFGLSQDEYFQIAVVIESPFLRGEFGIYQVKKKVCDKLLGFQPKNSNVLTVVSAGYQAEKMSQNEGVFTFTVVFETRGMAVQFCDETEISGPPISEITVDEPIILTEDKNIIL